MRFIYMFLGFMVFCSWSTIFSTVYFYFEYVIPKYLDILLMLTILGVSASEGGRIAFGEKSFGKFVYAIGILFIANLFIQMFG